MSARCDHERAGVVVFGLNLGTEAYANKKLEGDTKQFVSMRTDASLGSCQNLGPDRFLTVDAVAGAGLGELDSGMAGGRVSYNFSSLRFGAGAGVRYNFDASETTRDDSISGYRGVYGQLEWAVLIHLAESPHYFGLRGQAMLTTAGDGVLTTGIEYGFK